MTRCRKRPGGRVVRLTPLAMAALGTGCALSIPDPPPPITVDPLAAAGFARAPHAARTALPVHARQLSPPPLFTGGLGISWRPLRPLQGTVLAIRVRGGSTTDSLDIQLAGRDVSLARIEDGWVGIAALPLDSAGPLELVARQRSGQAAYGHEHVVLARDRQYASTRLRVAPRGEDRPEVQARIAEDQERIRTALGATSPEWLPREPFRWPRPPEFTSPFGQRRVFNGTTRSRHLGLDLRGSRGTPVRAPAAARVALVGDFFYQGNAVYLDHGLGLVTAYFHLSRLDVREGERVEPGQLLGLVGSTGRSTAPHLHWSAYVNGHNVDPASLIGLELELPPTRPAFDTEDGDGR